MALSDLKFEESDFAAEGTSVSSLPDKVIGQASYIKGVFDNIAKNMIALGKWNELIDLLAGTDGFLPKSGGTMTGTLNAQNIIPVANNTYNSGSSSKRWKYLYGNYADFGNILTLSNGEMAIINCTGTKNWFSIRNAKGIAFHDASGSSFTDINFKNAFMKGNSPSITSDSSVNWLTICCEKGVACRNQANSAFVNLTAANLSSSSERYKENIREMSEEECRKVLEIIPVEFDWKKDSGWVGHSKSAIAERAAEIDESYVYRNPNGEVEGLLTNPILMSLLGVVKAQQKQIEDLTKRIEALEAKEG